MNHNIKRRIDALEAVQADPMHSPRLIVITSPDGPQRCDIIGYRANGKDWLAQDGESLAQLAKRILAAANGRHVIAGVITRAELAPVPTESNTPH